MKAKIMIGIITGFIGLTSCFDDNKEPFYERNITFEFNTGTHGWIGDFADYPVTDSVFYELQFSHTALPAPLSTSTKALKISGNNHSDDLFMFIKRKITDLAPYTTYDVIFNIDLASNAPTNAVGVGGAPGEGVTLKVGATRFEPKKIAQGGSYTMNLNKANQSQSGTDMKAIGNIGVSDTTTVFTIINRNNVSAPFVATTDSTGSLWLVVGTESGFEATTTLYYKAIDILFRMDANQ